MISAIGGVCDTPECEQYIFRPTRFRESQQDVIRAMRAAGWRVSSDNNCYCPACVSKAIQRAQRALDEMEDLVEHEWRGMKGGRSALWTLVGAVNTMRDDAE